ncbi:MAG: response regulator transcription factor [Solirubrobacteraceae bacterium]|nr:response regulator transcription factor [Solirubrobacteraceae bacterium]
MAVVPTVLLADAPRADRQTLQHALVGEGFDVRTVADGLAALAVLVEHPPHAVVIGDGLPLVGSAELCRRIRTADAEVGIVVLARSDRVDDRVEALRAGADDCIASPYALREVVARVEAVSRRARVVDGADQLIYADVRLDRAGHTAWRGERRLDLTRTEFRLLGRLLANPEVVHGRSELLTGVWGYDPGAASNSLGVYVGYLRRKLEAAGEPRVVHTVRGAGYVLRTAA